MDENLQNNNLKQASEQDANFEFQENFDSDDIYNENKKNNTISPNFIFGFLLVIAAGTLVFGFISLSSSIYGPNKNFLSRQEELNNSQGSEVSDLLELQTMDTDKDGLFDYDELYLYNTSPYLADTDSDGFLDKEELDSGHDPLCPVGQDCRGTESGGGEEINNNGAEEVLPDEEQEVLPPELLEELKQMTPEQVRQLLLDSGEMTAEELQLIDDETLMEIFGEVINSQ